MKKIYIQPSVINDNMTTIGMIASSNPNPLFNPDEETTEMDSRRRTRTVWEDEDGDNF